MDDGIPSMTIDPNTQWLLPFPQTGGNLVRATYGGCGAPRYQMSGLGACACKKRGGIGFLGLGGLGADGTAEVAAASTVNEGTNLSASQQDELLNRMFTIGRWLGYIGAATGVYHGWNRNRRKSDRWIGAAVWGLFGFVLPVIAVPVMLVQGIGKR